MKFLVLIFLVIVFSEPRVVFDHNPNSVATREFKFKSIASPAKDDAATNAKLTMIDGELEEGSAELAALTDLAESYRIGNRHNEAIATFELAWARLAAYGRDDTATGAQLLDLWALSLEGAGRPLEAEPLYRRAIAINRSDNSGRNLGSWLLRDYATTLRDLGKLDEAAQYAAPR